MIFTRSGKRVLPELRHPRLHAEYDLKREEQSQATTTRTHAHPGGRLASRGRSSSHTAKPAATNAIRKWSRCVSGGRRVPHKGAQHNLGEEHDHEEHSTAARTARMGVLRLAGCRGPVRTAIATSRQKTTCAKMPWTVARSVPTSSFSMTRKPPKRPWIITPTRAMTPRKRSRLPGTREHEPRRGEGERGTESRERHDRPADRQTDLGGRDVPLGDQPAVELAEPGEEHHQGHEPRPAGRPARVGPPEAEREHRRPSRRP